MIPLAASRLGDVASKMDSGGIKAERGSAGRRGILFTVVFSLIFLGFLSFVILSSDFFLASESSFVSARRTLRALTLADGAASDLAGLMQLSVSAVRTQTNVTLAFSDHLPSPYASPSQALSDTESFFENSFAPKLNVNVSLDTAAFSANPYIYANGSAVNYSYDSLAKSALNLSAPSAAVTAYSITLRFDGAEAVNDSGWAWSSCSLPCAGSDVEMRLNVSSRTTDAPLPIAGCTAGCVSSASTQTFGMNSTSPDILNVTRSPAGLALRVSPSANLDSVISVSVNYTNATAVTFPVSLSIANLTGMNSTVPALPLLRV